MQRLQVVRKGLSHAPLWEVNVNNTSNRKYLNSEYVRLDSGLYTGNRDTEPRTANIYHFIIEDRYILLVNLHLTTLKGEREGFPEKDFNGSQVRCSQIDIILNGVVSRYNSWFSQQELVQYGKEPLWILCGDFNGTPDSPEINKILQMTGLDAGQPAPDTSVLVVNIGAKKGNKCPDDHWLYTPESQAGFHRVGFYSNVDVSFLPKSSQKFNNRVRINVFSCS